MEANITSAFVKAYRSVKNPELDCVNDYHGNRYASLAATLGVIRDACYLQDIVYIQRLSRDESGFCIKSMVMDESGNTLDLSEFPIEVPMNPQAFGSNLTYAKRQQAQLDWGITGEEDDDAEAATPKEGDLTSARDRAVKALEGYAERHGADAKALMDGIKKRPDYAQNVGFYDKLVKEFSE